jgi:hypothetical protein
VSCCRVRLVSKKSPLIAPRFENSQAGTPTNSKPLSANAEGFVFGLKVRLRLKPPEETLLTTGSRAQEASVFCEPPSILARLFGPPVIHRLMKWQTSLKAARMKGEGFKPGARS